MCVFSDFTPTTLYSARAEAFICNVVLSCFLGRTAVSVGGWSEAQHGSNALAAELLYLAPSCQSRSGKPLEVWCTLLSAAERLVILLCIGTHQRFSWPTSPESYAAFLPSFDNSAVPATCKGDSGRLGNGRCDADLNTAACKWDYGEPSLSSACT